MYLDDAKLEIEALIRWWPQVVQTLLMMIRYVYEEQKNPAKVVSILSEFELFIRSSDTTTVNLQVAFGETEISIGSLQMGHQSQPILRVRS